MTVKSIKHKAYFIATWLYFLVVTLICLELTIEIFKALNIIGSLNAAEISNGMVEGSANSDFAGGYIDHCTVTLGLIAVALYLVYVITK